MPIIVNGKKTNEIHFKYGAYVDYNEPVPTLKYGNRPGTVVIRKGKPKDYIEFDSNNGGYWKYYFSIPVFGTDYLNEPVQYKIEFTESSVNVWSNDLQSILATRSIVNFWDEATKANIRVFDENYQQKYFWIEKFDPVNKHAIIWVSIEPGQKEVNIAYGNDSCFESGYNVPSKCFRRVIDGLVGCWHFDEGQDNTVYDSSGYNRHGTINNVTWTDAGYYGKALYFNDGEVVIENSENMDGYEQLTVISRIYPTQSSSQAIVFNKEVCYELALINLNICWAVCNSIFWEWISTGYTVKLNKWYFIAWVYESANSIKTYVGDENSNMSLHTGSYGSGNISTSNRKLKIGNRYIANCPFKGIIDEVMIFNKALTNEEIQDLYNNHGIGGHDGKCYVRKIIEQDLQFGTISINEF